MRDQTNLGTSVINPDENGEARSGADTCFLESVRQEILEGLQDSATFSTATQLRCCCWKDPMDFF